MTDQGLEADKLADMLTGSVEEWIKAGYLGLAHSTLVGAVTVGLLSSGRAAEVAGMSMRDWRAVEQRVLRPSHTMAVSKMVSAADVAPPTPDGPAKVFENETEAFGHLIAGPRDWRGKQADEWLKLRGVNVEGVMLKALPRILERLHAEQVVEAMGEETRSAIVHALYARAFPSWDQSDGVTEELALSLIEQRDEALAHAEKESARVLEQQKARIVVEQAHSQAVDMAREAIASAQERKVLIDRATGALTDSGVAPTYPPEAGILALTAERDEALAVVEALAANLARISEELDLPPSIGPAPGELRKLYQRDAAWRAEVEKGLQVALARAEKAEAKLEYVSGYQADLVAIDRVLDQMDAPHDPEDGASLSPKRIRLLAEERDQAIRERDEARVEVKALIDAGKDLREVTREHEWPRACRAWDSALRLAAPPLPPERTDAPIPFALTEPADPSDLELTSDQANTLEEAYAVARKARLHFGDGCQDLMIIEECAEAIEALSALQIAVAKRLNHRGLRGKVDEELADALLTILGAMPAESEAWVWLRGKTERLRGVVGEAGHNG